MGKVKPKHSHSPDGFTMFFLKELRDALCFPLAHIFEQSFVNGIPEKWLAADVIAVFKKGNSYEPLNYRPISLLSNCCKIMESIINDSVVIYVYDTNLLCSNQHGFVSKKSTCTKCSNVWY